MAWWPNPLTYLLAVGIIGSRQLGLAILMHDGAHGCLSPDEKTNLALSQWFCAYPIFAETRAYRRYHLQHHARTQQDDDPDLILSAPFPITKLSYRRKFWRDISGQTGYQQRKAQLLNALGPTDWPLSQRAAHFWEKLGPQCVVNAVMFAGLAAAGVWWAYPLLWLVPLLTWMMVITRIRNIAEHAVVPDSTDPLRNTRTTHANFLERLFIAPYYVNYHLEHHLLFYIPCYNLPRVHRILAESHWQIGWKRSPTIRRAAACDRQTQRRGPPRPARQQPAPGTGRRGRGRRPEGRRLLGPLLKNAPRRRAG